MLDEEDRGIRFTIRQHERPDDIETQTLRDSIDRVESRLEQLTLNMALNSSVSTELARKTNFSSRVSQEKEIRLERLVETGIRDLLSSPLTSESEMSQRARRMQKFHEK